MSCIENDWIIDKLNDLNLRDDEAHVLFSDLDLAVEYLNCKDSADCPLCKEVEQLCSRCAEARCSEMLVLYKKEHPRNCSECNEPLDKFELETQQDSSEEEIICSPCCYRLYK